MLRRWIGLFHPSLPIECRYLWMQLPKTIGKFLRALKYHSQFQASHCSILRFTVLNSSSNCESFSQCRTLTASKLPEALYSSTLSLSLSIAHSRSQLYWVIFSSCFRWNCIGFRQSHEALIHPPPDQDYWAAGAGSTILYVIYFGCSNYERPLCLNDSGTHTHTHTHVLYGQFRVCVAIRC